MDGDNDGAKVRKEFQVTLADRDARIAEYGGEIADTAKTAERLCTGMDELRRQGVECRSGSGCR